MTMKNKSQSGFSLLEMLAVAAFITVITGSVFMLLNTGVQRYQMESEVVDSFQTARLGIDQMSRDIHEAGFPPANTGWKILAGQPTALPFAWDPAYPATPCTVGVNCATPNQFDLIIEGEISPSTGAGVQWIRYTLQGTTLMRGVVPKVAGADPVAATSAAGVMLPYVDNVINNDSAAQMAFLRGFYPGMFPGNIAVPVFTYECNSSATPPAPLPCTNANVVAPNNTAPYISQVGITLIVESQELDPMTHQPRVVSLHTDAVVMNPSQ
jgi:type II secretory pathway pseudopilin PulG